MDHSLPPLVQPTTPSSSSSERRTSSSSSPHYKTTVNKEEGNLDVTPFKPIIKSSKSSLKSELLQYNSWAHPPSQAGRQAGRQAGCFIGQGGVLWFYVFLYLPNLSQNSGLLDQGKGKATTLITMKMVLQWRAQIQKRTSILHRTQLCLVLPLIRGKLRLILSFENYLSLHF